MKTFSKARVTNACQTLARQRKHLASKPASLHSAELPEILEYPLAFLGFSYGDSKFIV